ncbi:putative ribosomal protein S11, mitochondrial [Capsicum annuum]|uniref:Ribosomal protein S11, mitochondrial n=1 Tax=Capsicum annuum TaxID=4072 RepID=A0A2G2YQ81_CAPAN|nr:putative ribosomal protein S11, mitochondrial [Capsicum annuum]
MPFFASCVSGATPFSFRSVIFNFGSVSVSFEPPTPSFGSINFTPTSSFCGTAATTPRVTVPLVCTCSGFFTPEDPLDPCLHLVQGKNQIEKSSHRALGTGIPRKTERKIYSNQHLILGMNPYSPYNVGRRCFIQSVSPKEAEMGNNSRPMDIIRELTEDSKRVFPSGVPLARYHIEQDADIVHMKVLRNNAFVTVTDSKGNRKFGATAGKLTGKGTKIARYAAESTAEHVGREARDRGLKSVVMKVNGFTYFKKKKQAILSFREGYTHSRGDKNPVVYIEDTTRRPHNGCRLPKKRRI